MGGSNMLDGNTVASILRSGEGLGRAEDRAEQAEDAAEAAEIDAAAAASEERRSARDEAERLSRRNRADKARRMADFGRSGLVMAGSPLLAAQARAAEDEDEAQEVLTGGRRRAQDVLARGRARAAGLRSRPGYGGSLLNLGGSLWDRLDF